MGIRLRHSVSALVSACGRHVSRASRRLRNGGGSRLWSFDRAARVAPSWAPYLSRRVSLIPFRGWRNKKRDPRDPEQARRGWWKRRASEEEAWGDCTDVEWSSVEEEEELEEEEEEEEEGVWRRRILMGEKCQPLDFSGVIYYDCEGRRLPELPLRSPLPSFSFPVVVVAEKGDGR